MEDAMKPSSKTAPNRHAVVMSFPTMARWEAWLSKKSASSAGLWLKLYKPASGKASLTYVQALHGALCYGWVDGRKRMIDESSWLQEFKPRPPKRRWSRLHTENAERLIKAGRMQAAGLKQVRAAKRDGRWRWAYHPPGSAKIPMDLLQGLDRDERARALFESLSRAESYAVAYKLQAARDPQVRARLLKDILKRLFKGLKPLR
jgi:uncharacterized protein YdeI (YjbR/CyaY-like superfamily)